MLNRKGQSTLEYAIVVAVIVGGLLAMQYYIKRGWEGRLKGAADNMGEQFEPAKYTANLNFHQSSNVKQDVAGGVTTTTHQAEALDHKDGTETVATWDTSKDVYEK